MAGLKPRSRGSVALLLLAVVLLALAAFFGVRTYQAWQTLHRPPAAEPGPIRPRMSVRFIARSQRVPLAEFTARLGAPADGNITLVDLASKQGVPVLQVEQQARQAVADLRVSGSGSGPPVRGPGE